MGTFILWALAIIGIIALLGSYTNHVRREAINEIRTTSPPVNNPNNYHPHTIIIAEITKAAVKTLNDKFQPMTLNGNYEAMLYCLGYCYYHYQARFPITSDRIVADMLDLSVKVGGNFINGDFTDIIYDRRFTYETNGATPYFIYSSIYRNPLPEITGFISHEPEDSNHFIEFKKSLKVINTYIATEINKIHS